VFIVVGQDVRKCLICEQVFTRQASAEHVMVLCKPGVGDVLRRIAVWEVGEFEYVLGFAILPEGS